MHHQRYSADSRRLPQPEEILQPRGDPRRLAVFIVDAGDPAAGELEAWWRERIELSRLQRRNQPGGRVLQFGEALQAVADFDQSRVQFRLRQSGKLHAGAKLRPLRGVDKAIHASLD